jgi:hypothetical protein
MNFLRPLLSLACVLAATALLSAKDFEGHIKMEIRDGKNAMPLTYSVKKDRMRMDLSAEGTTMTSLVDFEKKEMIVLMPGQNMYMVMAMQDVAGAASKANTGTPLEKTSETETILGYLCTKYVSTERGVTTEIWAAEGIGNFMAANSSGNPMRQAARNKWEQDLVDKGAFPLRVVSRNRGGKETSRMEVVAIDKRSVPDSHFAIPDGYQRFEMGGMMKGLMKGLVPGAK